MKMAGCCQNGKKTMWEKEKLLVMSNFSFSHDVLKGLMLQTHKNQGLFGKGLEKKKLQSILLDPKEKKIIIQKELNVNTPSTCLMWLPL